MLTVRQCQADLRSRPAANLRDNEIAQIRASERTYNVEMKREESMSQCYRYVNCQGRTADLRLQSQTRGRTFEYNDEPGSSVERFANSTCESSTRGSLR